MSKEGGEGDKSPDAIRLIASAASVVSTLPLVDASPASDAIMLGTACTVPVTRIHACSGSVGMRVFSGGGARNGAGPGADTLDGGTTDEDDGISPVGLVVTGST